MKNINPSISAIAFDLDDTLLDTSGILVPQASLQAFESLQSAHLRCDFQRFDLERKALSQSHSHREIFLILAQKWAAKKEQIESAAREAVHRFYNPQIPKSLPLMDGAKKNLEDLSKYHLLFLVTSGDPATQRAKIQALEIINHFKEVFILDGLKDERKLLAFKSLSLKHHLKPSQLLSFGNRLSQEIRDGKAFGAWTCHFSYGEHREEKPTCDLERPDFVIEHHRELIPTCQLRI